MRNISRSFLFGIPQIFNFNDLAFQLKISEGLLYKLSHLSGRFYRRVEIPKKRGGVRIIHCPSKNMKAIQLWILRYILEAVEPTPYAKAFKKNTSILDNVKPHINNNFFLCLDIKNFYGSINFDMVFNVFLSLGYKPEVATILSKICTLNNSLPQGAVTSPALSNICCIWLDMRLSQLAGQNNIIYTRYADDMTFSSVTPSNLLRCKPTITKIIQDEGFLLNSNKTRMLGFRNRREITGLIITNNKTNSKKEHSIRIGNVQKKKIRAAIHNLSTGKVKDEDKELVNNWIKGWFNYLKSIDPISHKQLEDYYKKAGNLESE